MQYYAANVRARRHEYRGRRWYAAYENTTEDEARRDSYDHIIIIIITTATTSL